MREKPKQKLDGRIAELEARLEKLRAIRAALDDEEIAPDLAELFREQNPGQVKNIDKMRSFFDSCGNKWATVVQIGEGTKLKWGSVRQILYKTHKQEFDSRSHPKGGRTKQFRMRKASSQ